MSQFWILPTVVIYNCLEIKVEKEKALELNVNKDRVAHCVLQLERSVAPDGAVIQLANIPFYSPSQGIT